MLRFKRKVLLFKKEVTYGLDATPVAATDGLLVRNLRVQALALNAVRREVARTFYANEGQIVTGTYSTLEFEVEMAGAGGTADAIPKYAPCLMATGHAQTVTALTSVSYDPVTGSEDSGTAYFQVDGRQHKILGCRGSLGMRVRAGEIPVFTFRFIGLHVQPTDAALTPADLSGFTKPLAVNNANTTPFTLHAYAGKFREFTFDQAADVKYRNLPNSESVAVTGRLATGKVTLESELVATKDWWTIIKGETSGAFTFTHGSAVGNKVQFTGPAAQIMAPDESEEEGILMLSAGLEFKSSGAGNNEYQIKTM